jgi:succinate dehydrogenase/fumarate reductase flavoprotein subunit
MTQFLGKVAQIVRLQDELARRKRELDGLKVDYIRMCIADKTPWRKVAAKLHMDVGNLHKFARKNGLVK